jgi:uncharacterized protein YfeS
MGGREPEQIGVCPLTPMDGYNKIVWWLMGMFAMLFLAAAGLWVNAIDRKTDTNLLMNIEQGARISKLETIAERALVWQVRIEGKIDDLLEEAANDRASRKRAKAE